MPDCKHLQNQDVYSSQSKIWNFYDSVDHNEVEIIASENIIAVIEIFTISQRISL